MNLFKTEEIIVITAAWVWNVKYIAQILSCVVPQNIHTLTPSAPQTKGMGNSRGVGKGKRPRKF